MIVVSVVTINFQTQRALRAAVQHILILTGVFLKIKWEAMTNGYFVIQDNEDL